MTLSRKHSRPITVEGKPYRWMLKETDYGARFELLLVVEAVDCPNGERLVAHFEADDRRDDDSVTPSVVESLIKAGIAGGWAPSRPGSCPALGHTLRDLLAERRAKVDSLESSFPLIGVRNELVRPFGPDDLVGPGMLTDHIRSLEEQLLDCDVRTSGARLDRLIADDFIEFGASGRVYTKPEIIATLLSDPSLGPGAPKVKDFQARVLAPDVVLATYRCGQSLRSSVWRRDDAGWRMVFHQGTRTSSDPSGEDSENSE